MIHLITGGAGSGKSAYAEQKILELGEGRRIYVATMFPGVDPENSERIQKHRDRRAPMNFETIECPTNLSAAVIPENSNVLLEDVGNLVANEMFLPDASGIHAVNSVLDGFNYLMDIAANLIIVTNEINSDGVDYDNATRVFQQFMGLVNQELGELADKVTEVVYGIPLTVK
ncbi:MAG: bifunctional adenosylcobinamide kinase/adenosylcobinamide-phosphate guanylyltransferase [Bilifractor sp.]